WLTSYSFPESDFPGMLVGLNAKGKLVTEALVGPNDVAGWVPAEAMNVNREQIQSGVKLITGDLAYMFVTFANNSQRFPVTSQTPSGTHDVAIIRADIMEDLNPVKLLNNYDEIEPGSKAIVMGYPAMSPDQFVAVRSKDAFNTNPEIVKVPVPTISEGIVGRLIKSGAGTTKVDEYRSMMGDYYQLTVNSTGPGNSGGPMFDNKGNVIGIYSAGSAKMSYAIPIKYAMELMGRSSVTK
ncbi:MAG: serine protease, partial [Pedobacter sp.]